MPYKNAQWSAITLNNQIILRQGLWQGLVVESNIWPLMSQHWQQKQISVSTVDVLDDEDKENSAISIVINAYATLPETTNVSIQPMPEELPLALLAQHVDVKLVNLLQGEFQVKD